MFRNVFFFKQRTAYEMRISDWGSDVCSSDLEVSPAPGDDAVDLFGDVFLDADVEARVRQRGLVVAHGPGVRPLRLAVRPGEDRPLVGLLGQHVVGEQQLAARADHADDLLKQAVLVLHRAERSPYRKSGG